MPYFTPPTNTTSPSLSSPIFYTTHGPATGTPILLLHGWTCDQHDWNFLIPALVAASYYIIALDLPGHGRSIPSPSTYISKNTTITYTPTTIIPVLTILLSSINITQPVFAISHSYGSILASVLAVQHPQIVQGIVILDPAYWISNTTAPAIVSSVTSPTSSPESFAVAQFLNFLPTPAVPEWQRNWYLTRALGTPSHVVRDYIVSAYEPNGIGIKENFVKYVKGRREVPKLALYASAEEAGWERELLGFDAGRGDEVGVVGGSGHWFHHVKAEEVNGRIVGWLGRQVGRMRKE